jgi:hypothetical protein
MLVVMLFGFMVQIGHWFPFTYYVHYPEGLVSLLLPAKRVLSVTYRAGICVAERSGRFLPSEAVPWELACL